MNNITKYNIIKDYARACQYMYRKGVKDASEVFNPNIVNEFLRDNSIKDNYKFIFDEGGRDMKLDYFCCVVQMFLIKINARRGAMLLNSNEVGKRLRRESAQVLNAYYHKGLDDGKLTSINEAKDFFYENETFGLFRELKGNKMTLNDFILDIQIQALRLSEGEDDNSGSNLWGFIGDAIREFYARKSRPGMY